MCVQVSLTCTQTLKSPLELSLNGKLEEKKQAPELFLVLQKRLGTARLAASQSVQQENQSLEKERGCGFPSSFSILKLYFTLLLLSVCDRLSFLF